MCLSTASGLSKEGWTRILDVLGGVLYRLIWVFAGHRSYCRFCRALVQIIIIVTSHQARHETWREKTYLSNMCPTKAQPWLRIHAVLSESSLSAWRNFASFSTQYAPSEDSDQSAWMRRLIWVFTGCVCPKILSLTMRPTLFRVYIPLITIELFNFTWRTVNHSLPRNDWNSVNGALMQTFRYIVKFKFI